MFVCHSRGKEHSPQLALRRSRAISQPFCCQEHYRAMAGTATCIIVVPTQLAVLVGQACWVAGFFTNSKASGKHYRCYELPCLYVASVAQHLRDYPEVTPLVLCAACLPLLPGSPAMLDQER